MRTTAGNVPELISPDRCAEGRMRQGQRNTEMKTATLQKKVTVAQLAKVMNVSERSIYKARRFSASRRESGC
jgi:hypothetical protein